MKKYCLLVIALTICCISHATITVTKTTCNYQAEDAVIEKNIQVVGNCHRISITISKRPTR